MRTSTPPVAPPTGPEPGQRRSISLTGLLIAAAVLFAGGWYGHREAIARGWTVGARAQQHQSSYLPVAPPLTSAVTLGIGCPSVGERPTLRIRLFGQPKQPINVTAYYAPGKTSTAGTVHVTPGTADVALGELPIGTTSADVWLVTANRPTQHVFADLDCSTSH
jgi:hypothetical protein